MNAKDDMKTIDPIDNRGGCAAWAGKSLRSLEGDLPPAEAKAFHAHLPSCALCRKEIALFEEIFRAVREMPDPVPAPGFDTAVLRALFPPRWEEIWKERALLLARVYGAMLAGLFGALAIVGVVVVGQLGVGRSFAELVDSMVVALLGFFEGLAYIVVWAAKWLDVIAEVAGKFEPLVSSMGVAARAYQGEILGMMLVLTLLALLGIGQVAPRLERRMHRAFLTI